MKVIGMNIVAIIARTFITPFITLKRATASRIGHSACRMSRSPRLSR